MRIEIDELGSGENGVEIAVKGFAGFEDSQVYVEVYEGKLQVHVWDGSGDDPVAQVKIQKSVEAWDDLDRAPSLESLKVGKVSEPRGYGQASPQFD